MPRSAASHHYMLSSLPPFMMVSEQVVSDARNGPPLIPLQHHIVAMDDLRPAGHAEQRLDVA
jgi:hypothetical protein